MAPLKTKSRGSYERNQPTFRYRVTRNNRAIRLDVVSKNAHSTCHKCGKPATKRNGTAPSRLIRHLPILDKPVYLRITPVRYSCDSCGDHTTTTEQYEWCNRNSSTTKGLEEYLMRSLIHSTIEDVSKKEKIGQKVIQSILDRLVNNDVDWSFIKDLQTMGIDEISMKRDINHTLPLSVQEQNMVNYL